jgi:hypothetical protein
MPGWSSLWSPHLSYRSSRRHPPSFKVCGGLPSRLSLLLVLLFGYLLAHNYVIEERDLVVRSGPLRWHIPIHEIEDIQPTRNPLSSEHSPWKGWTSHTAVTDGWWSHPRIRKSFWPTWNVHEDRLVTTQISLAEICLQLLVNYCNLIVW